MKFRIYTNDRGRDRGVFLYSAFRDISARDAGEARRMAETRFGPFTYAGEHGPLKAIEWPVTTDESRAWLTKHVGA